MTNRQAGNRQPGLEDLLALSAQLNRQAFAQPPVDGWLKSFLSLLCERFAPLSMEGVQVLHIVGNMALQVADAGAVPVEQGKQTVIDRSSPIAQTVETRQMATMPHAHLYPILVGNEAIGVLVAYFDVDSNTVGTIDMVMTALAIQLGPALLQHIKTPGPQTGKLIRQIDRMRSLHAVTRDFSGVLDQPDLLKRAARSLVETLRIDHVSILVFNFKEKSATVISEYPDHGVMGTRYNLDSAVLERLIQTRASVIVSNVDRSSELGAERTLLQQLGVKSVAILPMIVDNDLIGGVELDAFYDYRQLSADEIEAADAITSQLAISAHNAQLYEELRRRARQLEHVTDLSRRITSTFDRNRIFEYVREETKSILDVDLIVVTLRNPENPTGMLSMYILVDSGPILAEIPLDRSALRFVLNTGEPLVIDDITGSEDADYRLLAGSQMRALAAVPLIAGGRANGVFLVLHRESAHFVSIDMAVLEQIGSQLAVALENSRLYTQTLQRAETERLMNRLSGSIQSRGDLQSIVLGTVQEIAEALGARRARVRLEMPTKTDRMNERR